MKLRWSAYRLRFAMMHAVLGIFLLFASAPGFAAEKLIVAFGDSLMAGYGLKPGEGFAPRLEATLRAQRIPARVHNAGVSGDTTAAGKARLGWVLRGLGRKPDLVIVELGGNDMLRGIKPEQTRANLDAIMAELRRRQIKFVVAGMLASPNMGPAYSRVFNTTYPLLSRKYGAPLYPFFMRGVAGNRALLLKDGIHPNPRGVNVIVGGITPVVKAALGVR
jgi:acyl-CoA thioesterase I